MSLVMQGQWTVSVKSKEAAAPQRFTIAGAASGNGTHVVSGAVAPVPVNGASWTIAIDSQVNGNWVPSVMRFKTPVAFGAQVLVDIESNDAGPDQDFNDLILTCSMAASGSDFVVYGHATAYSGHCLYNPCIRHYLVIDSALQLQEALKNRVIRAAIEQLYPEVLLPSPKNPPDPGPLRTFTPLVLPTPRSAALPARAFQVSRGEAASKAGANVMTREVVMSKSAAPSLLSDELTAQLGRLVEGSARYPYRCATTTLANYGLRVQEYDRTTDELGGGAYTGTGDRENLGTTATDAFGNYLFRFSRSPGDFAVEAIGDVAVGEDASVQVLPDVIVQVLGAGQIPAAETACVFNIPNLRRIDICVPAGSIVLPTGCADNHILTFIGKISLTSSLNALDATGRITATSTAGNAPTMICGVWAGKLDLWGCLGQTFGSSAVDSYTVRYRPLGGGAADWVPHAVLETREVGGGGAAKKIGPFFDLALAVPSDPTSLKVFHPRYLNAERDPTIVQPGAFLKATLGADGFAAGSYEVRIDGYDPTGNLLRSQSITLYVDNAVPTVSISNITLAGVPVNISGNGCTLQTLGPAELSGDLDVRFIVSHPSGAILNYALGIARCNEGALFPVNYVAGGEPSFSWVHDAIVSCETPPNFRQGTPEDPDNDGSGFVTTTLSPVTPWLGATENFTILRASISYNWRATNGYSNASGFSYGPLVWGIQK